MIFTDIDDRTNSLFYSVSSATGISKIGSPYLELVFSITNANGIKINPKATITYADGSTQTCQETDQRRYPSLVRTTTTWEFPCQGSFGDPSGATVAVVDEYQ